MNTDQALIKLGTQTSEAVQGILRMFSSTGVVGGDVGVASPGQNPFADFQMPCIAASVSYTDGVTGGNVLLIGVEGARRLAASMMGGDPTELPPAEDLDELEYSAIGEAMNQMMAATAMATSTVLGDEVEIGVPEIKRVTSMEETTSLFDHTGHSTTVTFSFFGAPCLLVQLVPNAFIVRMTRALDEITATHDDDRPFSEGLRDVQVRVWAELGRTRMASGRAVELPPGAVIELDRLVDDAVDVYVDGMRFASCRLIVCDDGGLAMRLEEIFTIGGTVDVDAAETPETPEPPESTTPEEVAV
ncbi:MAG: FliM/FliN family flagellar motor switch protein [Baekduia sp.]